MAHIESLKLFLVDRPAFHVIAVTETKLGPLVDDDLVDLQDLGYTLVRNDRVTEGLRSGGVALYIHRSLSFKVLCESTHTWVVQPGLPEYIFAEVSPRGGNPIFVGVVYRPPHSPFLHGSNFMEELTAHMHDYSTKVLVGDFNADQLSQSEDAKFLRRFVDENSLQLTHDRATFHTATSDSQLDLCMIDQDDTLLDCWQTDVPFINGHDLLAFTVSVDLPHWEPPDFHYRDFRSVRADDLNGYLRDCDWSPFRAEDPVLECCLECLYSHLTEALDLFVPLKRVCQKGRKFPWITPSLRELVRRRDKLYRRYKHTKWTKDLYAYRRARDLAHDRVEEARLLYYQSRLVNLTDQNHIWRELKHLGVLPKPTSCTPDHSADELNAHFSGISYRGDAPSIPTDFDPARQDLAQCFSFTPVTEDKVRQALSRSNSQAVGVDGLPQGFLVAAFPVISPFVTAVFNLSLATGIFPERWRHSVVIPINKVKTPMSAGDYRPISLLCTLSKVFERIVHEQLDTFISSNNLLDVYQSGFRAGYSTETALLKLTDDIRLGRDARRRLVTVLLLFDFSKAFDTVDHSALLTKLGRLGFSPHVLGWFASYLGPRTQAVKLPDHSMSSFRPINTGVPQGSVLGPLLFALYINDVGRGLGVGVRHLIYADDLQVYIQCHYDDLEVTLRRLGACAARIGDWAEENRLRLNIAKTKAIVFGSYHYINLISDGDYGIDVHGARIPLESSVRNLGVVLDSKLDWKSHVSAVVKRASSLMYRLYFFRGSTTLTLRIHLIKTLLFPLVNYCSLVCCDLSDEQNSRLQRVINTGIRYIFGLRKSEHISPYRRQLGWLTVSGRRKYSALCLLYKVIRSGTPSYISEFFLANASTRPRRDCAFEPLVVPRFGSESTRRSFHIGTTYMWNELPSSIRDASSIATFKRLLSSHLLDIEQ